MGKPYVTAYDLNFAIRPEQIDHFQKMMADMQSEWTRLLEQGALEMARSIHGSTVIRMPDPPPDPRIARDKARAEIDAVLREDARRFPAFATARRCAVMSECEPGAHVGSEDTRGRDAGRMLAMLHRYEERRGGLTVPRAEAPNRSRSPCPTPRSRAP